jgi:EAL domain-containing protein (putative c-di-GMP-specific phosphodiesterase class I)
MLPSSLTGQNAHEQALDFRTALEQLWMAYQPIVDGHAGTIAGYVALVRSDQPGLTRPDQLLSAAEQLGGLHTLGRKIRSTVADSLTQAPPHCPIFVNLHTADLDDEELYSPNAPLAGHARRIVFELTARASLTRLPDIDERVQSLRAMGYRIAVDDLGTGYAALSCLNRWQPDVVKLCRPLIRDVDSNAMKQRIIAAISKLCRSLDVTLIAEGVQSVAERDLLLEISGVLLQGYVYARPARGFATLAAH